MNRDEFWKLNEGLPPEEAAEVLRERLEPLEPAEIASYQEHFDALFAEAYQWKLWGAAYLIDGGCSDDGFMDFRYGLISRGRQIFEAALADPEMLVDVASGDGDDEEDNDEGFIPNEDFGYVAYQLYKEKTGDDMSHNTVSHPDEPSGENWDFDDADETAKRLPRLWERFGW